jgi:hypothetical protein
MSTIRAPSEIMLRAALQGLEAHCATPARRFGPTASGSNFRPLRSFRHVIVSVALESSTRAGSS